MIGDKRCRSMSISLANNNRVQNIDCIKGYIETMAQGIPGILLYLLLFSNKCIVQLLQSDMNRIPSNSVACGLFSRADIFFCCKQQVSIPSKIIQSSNYISYMCVDRYTLANLFNSACIGRHTCNPIQLSNRYRSIPLLTYSIEQQVSIDTLASLFNRQIGIYRYICTPIDLVNSYRRWVIKRCCLHDNLLGTVFLAMLASKITIDRHLHNHIGRTIG